MGTIHTVWINFEIMKHPRNLYITLYCVSQVNAHLDNNVAWTFSSLECHMFVDHYSDVMMSAIWCLKSSASRFGYSTVCSGTDQRKHQSSASLDCVREIHRWSVTGEFPAQRVSNAENVSIWWRLHLLICCGRICMCTQHKLTDLFHDRFDLHKAVSCLHNLPHQVHKLTGHIEKYAFIYWRLWVLCLMQYVMISRTN